MTTEVLGLISLTVKLNKNELTKMINIHTVCRVCANESDKFISIHSEDGVNNDLANKINLYLPIKVNDGDNLPLQCCWQCASTVLTWHELVLTSTAAEKKFRSYILVKEERLEEINDYKPPESTQSPSEEDAVNDACIYKDLHTGDFGRHKKKICQENQIPLNVDLDMEDPESIIPVKKDTLLRNFCSKFLKESVSFENNVYMFECSLCSTKFKTECDISNHITEKHPEIKDDEILFFEDKHKSSKEVNYEGIEEGLALNEDSDIEDQGSIIPGKSDTFLRNFCGASPDSIKKSVSFGNYECSLCSIKYKTERDICRHVNEKHPDIKLDQMRFFDNKLQNNNKNKRAMRKKKSTHRFTVKHMMNKPQQKIDQNIVNKAKFTVEGRVFYKCNECGKNLHSVYTYVWHMRIHTGERPYVCDLCGKQFRVSQGLVRHLKETHERIKNFECDICGRYFSTKRNAEEHRRIHTNERPYVCALCGKSFKQKASLFVHNRSHSTEFAFSCTYCSSKFRAKQSLMTHITRHTGEKPYPCDVCGRSFRIKYELKRHKLVHSDEKPFRCKVCGQSFRQKRYLRNHLKLNHHLANPNELIDNV